MHRDTILCKAREREREGKREKERKSESMGFSRMQECNYIIVLNFGFLRKILRGFGSAKISPSRPTLRRKQLKSKEIRS